MQRQLAVEVPRAGQPRRGDSRASAWTSSLPFPSSAAQRQGRTEGPRLLAVDQDRTTPIQRTREIQGVDGISFTVHPRTENETKSTPEHGLAAAIDGDHAAPTSTAPPRAFAASAQDLEVLGAAELMPAAGRPGVAHARRRGRRGTTVAVLVLLETWTRSRLARRGCR